MMLGKRLSFRSGRGVAAPGGVELLEPIWSWMSSSLVLLRLAKVLVPAIVVGGICCWGGVGVEVGKADC